MAVRQESYEWAGGELQHILFLRYVVRSRGPMMSGVWIGIRTQFASGDKTSYTCWPPASACSPYGSWYNKKWVVYEDSLRLLREHYCLDQPVPSGCALEVAPYWVGLKLLTPAGAQGVTLALWDWAPVHPARDTDAERYALMSSGTVADPSQFLPEASDPVELLALGPFATLAPGDSVVVSFALVGGPDASSIRDRARLAQLMFDNGYDRATPVATSLLASRADPDCVHLVWYTPEAGFRARVERRESSEPWRSIAEVAADPSGELVFDDRSVVPGHRYQYRLAFRDGGGTAYTDETELLVPPRPSTSITSVRWSGHGRQVEIGFALPRGASAQLMLLDPSGRLVAARSLEQPAAGKGSAVLEVRGKLAPGVYFVRLTQGADLNVRRVVLID
ncbi:MAG: hypothetical protein AUI33_01480 [Ignavibacteria bacterium 13_1_40CM_2_61_4]|nr:MAG: hypothetical protein AUI33_01480 [Ignavibacteria bacterium 13_1_40CM_2_61_4]